VIAVARYQERQPALERDLLDEACRVYFDLDALPTVNTARFD
jgi:hypothetical protein